MAVFLVTGGAGFIGSHLAEMLLGKGHEVRILDRSIAAGSPPRDRVQLVAGDLKDLDLVRQATRGVDTVFHLAMPSEWSDPASCVFSQHAATTGAMHVLIAARETGVKRVVYASCASVYGVVGLQHVTEDQPLAPASEFARAKETGEKDCYAFSYLYGLETVRVRFFSVYGPRQREDGPYARLIGQMLRRVLLGQIPELPGDGRGVMDMLYVDDAVYALQLVAETPRASGKVYNIGSGQDVTPLKILGVINRVMATSINPSYSQPRPRTEFDNLPDITRAETELGFCPAVNLETGLRQTLDFYLAAPPRPVDLGDPKGDSGAREDSGPKEDKPETSTRTNPSS